MIPQKLIIEGFLCYRTPQEIDLGDLPLCMLAGPNGSGKSTVFDAITFALFGTHRDGADHPEDLINKNCDTATIVYEFLLGGTPWRIYRTIRRSLRGTRVIGDVRRPSGKGDGQPWEVVPDTSSSSGLKNWVASNLAISSEAFTRSMLLRQGESDRLLSAKPKERFDVLAGIAELGKYQAVEAVAVARKNSTKDEVDRLASQLATVPPVSDEQLGEAARETQAAGDRVTAADQFIATLQEQQVHATHWADLKARLDLASKRRLDAARLVANADQIEADHQRLTVMTTVLPRLEAILTRRGSIAESKARVAAASDQRAVKQHALDAANSQAKASQENCAVAERLIPELEARQTADARKIADARRILDAADATEKLRTKLAEAVDGMRRIEKQHPHPDVQLRQARQEFERLTELTGALPTFEQFIDCRKNGVDAVMHRAEADNAIGKCTDAEKVLLRECEAADREVAAAQIVHQQAQHRDTEIATLLKHAKTALVDLENAEGKATCPTCGQELTPSHLSIERKRRGDEVSRLAADKIAAASARQEAESRIMEARRACADLGRRQQELTGQIQKLTATINQANQEMARTARECRRAYDALPEEWRKKVSPNPPDDWSQTTWPAIEDFQALRTEAKQCAPAVEQVKLLEKIVLQWRDLAIQAKTMTVALSTQAVEIPDDLPSLREDHARLEKDHADTGKRLASARETFRTEQQTLKRLGNEIRQLEAAIVKLAGLCDIEQSHQKNDEDAIQAIISQLPPDWTKCAADASEAGLNQWKSQLRELTGRGVVEAFKGLSEARSVLATIDARIAELESDIAAIPEPACQPPELLAAHLQEARTRRAGQEAARQEAQARHGELQATRRQRLELEQSQRAADRRLRHLEVLCKLLGRKELQLHLIRQAERKIVDCANVILYKLSAGNLRLQLRSDDTGDVTDQALDLVAIHQSTGGAEPIAVAFLSGSQRFRVAVSLALAIGQVAGNNRCGECVIIDEGFGSLDRQGQDVMIQELKQLRGIMKRIILVSHQESFADAFPHGYRFSIENGEARAQRMNG